MIFGLMRLEKFFERFDSAREKLRFLCSIDTPIGEPLSEAEISGVITKSKIILNGIPGIFNRYAGRTFEQGSFKDAKGDTHICGKWCYVPRSLVKDMRFAEGNYERYCVIGDAE